MKKKALVLGLVALFILGFLAAVAGTAQASCSSKRVDCNINKGTKMVGHSNFSYCYDWRNFCKPCHGFAHLAKWCNENYTACKGECWGCARWEEACYDSHGNRKKDYYP